MNLFFFTISGILFYSSLSFCNSGMKTQNSSLSLAELQGVWILYQDKNQKISISKDTVSHFYKRNIENKYILKLSKWVVSQTFNLDTIKATGDGFFIEEVNLYSKEVEQQYSVISYEKNKLVLSPLHSSQLLTYNRKKK